MTDDIDFDEIDRILRQDQICNPSSISTANEQNCRKRLKSAELIAINDKLVRRVKELEIQLQQLQCTASEVSNLYEKEKELRIQIEHRACNDDNRFSDLENQLDVQKLKCEQLEEEMKIKCLPVDAKNVAITFMQLTNRIAQDPCSGGLTRMEQNLQHKLRDYCKLANLYIPPCKTSTKKRSKVASATSTTTSSTQTVDLPMPAEASKPEMCSIAVQCENLITTRDQGIQHKNTTTTRSTTTASLIKMHDVGTCFPEPKSELTAHQILENMRLWTVEPLSPINGDFEPEEGIDVGTCTELCNVNREINFLPDMPAQLKHSDSRPPSRTMYDSIKDEQTMPLDATKTTATSDGSEYPMAKKLLSILPDNQSVLTEMSPQAFNEVWQVIAQILQVAVKSSISQADFNKLCGMLIVENLRAHGVAESSEGESHPVIQSNLNTSASNASRTDAVISPINEVPLDIGLDLTPIRLPPQPQCEKFKSKPKKIRTTPYSRPQALQQQDLVEPRSTSPTETAVTFLTTLKAFHDNNCDNFQITAEEQELLRRSSGILEKSKSSGLTETLTERSSKGLDLLLNATANKRLPTVGPQDQEQVPQSHIQDANTTQGRKEDFLELFGSESSSEDEETSSRETENVESNGNGAENVPMTVKKSNQGLQQQDLLEPISTSPTETAVTFLTTLKAFHDNNCDDFQISAEEQELLRRSSGILEKSKSSGLTETLTERSSKGLDLLLNATANKRLPTVGPQDQEQVPQSHIQDANTTQGRKEDLLELFGSESSSEDEETSSRETEKVESNGNGAEDVPMTVKKSNQGLQQQDLLEPISTSPTETAVTFLTTLKAFHDNNCDDFQISAEEQELLRRSSGILEKSKSSGLTETLTERSSKGLDLLLNATANKRQPTVGPLDQEQVPQSHIQDANTTQGRKEDLLELFGSESSSEDEETSSRETEKVESNGNGAEDVPMTVKKSNQGLQQQDLLEPISTSPTETAVTFLTTLKAFHDNNCDNFQITAEEQELLQRSSGLTETLTERSSKGLDLLLNATANKRLPTVGPQDQEQVPQSHIQDANTTQGRKEHLLELFGSESSSEDEETSSRETENVESNGNGAEDVPMTVKKSNQGLMQQDLVEPRYTSPTETENHITEEEQQLLRRTSAILEKSKSSGLTEMLTERSSKGLDLLLNATANKRQPTVGPLDQEQVPQSHIQDANTTQGRKEHSLELFGSEWSSEDEETPSRETENESNDRRNEESPVSVPLENSDSIDICLGLEDNHDSKTKETESPLNSLDTSVSNTELNKCRDRAKDLMEDMLPAAGTFETFEQVSDEVSDDSDGNNNLVINDDLLSDSAEDDQECLQSDGIHDLSAISSSESQMGLSEESDSEQRPCISSESQKGLNEETSYTEANTLVLQSCIPDQLSASESPVRQSLGKRKRNGSTSSEDQPMEKRVTRWQLKQMALENSNKLKEESQPSCVLDYSPMSPVNTAGSKVRDREPIEIPLDSPGDDEQVFTGVPSALTCYLANAVKADATKKANRKNEPTKRQRFHLKQRVADYLNQKVPLDKTIVHLEKVEDQLLHGVLIEVYGGLVIGKGIHFCECFLTLLKKLDSQRCSFVECFITTLEQRLFSIKDRWPDQVNHEFVKLQLQLFRLQATRAYPPGSYVNPARLLLAKILYYFRAHMSSLVLEVLWEFPTVLPHREERDYDHGDPLITVIKHLLMCYKYDVNNNGSDRTLISKLRYEYHFLPFEPNQQMVITNLVAKVKAGRSHELSYAFSLFCRRTANLNVANLVNTELLPLANTYCDLCVQSDVYDGRIICLLQCISMIIKQMQLNRMSNINCYVEFFKRILVVAPRPAVQEAAVQAILRMQRFGYPFVLRALKEYRPSYQLTPLTRAMLRSFAVRRHHYISSFARVAD